MAEAEREHEPPRFSCSDSMVDVSQGTAAERAGAGSDHFLWIIRINEARMDIKQMCSILPPCGLPASVFSKSQFVSDARDRGLTPSPFFSKHHHLSR